MRDVTLALRTLARSPLVTTVAVISLALGIGANTAIFSLFHRLLLRPLPVREPERLVNLAAPGPKPGSTSCNQAGDCTVVFSYPMFRDLERAQIPFTGIAAHRAFDASLAFRGQTVHAEGMLVSGSYFPLLGLTPELGRLLGPDDDRTIGGHFVAVLSYDYWANRLGADRDVLGQSITINGHPMTIIGVAPRGFEGTTLGTRAQVFVPITMRGVMTPGSSGFTNRRNYWVYLFARLRPGVSIDEARTKINAIYHPIITDVEAPLQIGMSEATMARFKAKAITVEDGRRGQSSIHRETRTPLLLLLSITGIVLLIACANIANLLLARAAHRALEMAVRLSLGASRWQIIRQLLTEAVLLSVAGGVASLLVARWTIALVTSILPPDAATTLRFELRVPVMIFTATLAVGTGLLFGLFPALHSTRPDLVTVLRANTGQPSGARAAARFRTALVTAQIALAMTLLISAGLFTKSLLNVARADLGLVTDHVVTFALSPELTGYTPPQSQRLFQRIEEELSALPGVTGVTASVIPILSGSNWGNDVLVEGFPSGPDIDRNARVNEIGPGYFRALGTPLLAGREFTTADGPGAPKVAIVNEAFARKFRLGRDAVGKHMAIGTRQQLLDVEIVGLVRDAKYSEAKAPPPPQYFTPYRQDTTLGALTFYVRTSLAPQSLLRKIPKLVAALDPALPVENLKTLPQQARENVALDRLIGVLSTAFAALATLLAAVGLYGVLAYTVAQRTREIGVRMALGADGRRVRAMVLRQVGRMTLTGAVLGLAAALALGRAAQSLLFGLDGHDPTVMAIAAIVLGLVAFGAGYAPALRASRVDPMQALRYE
jgi:predicted permease